MDKLKMISGIKEYYDKGGNIIQYLRDIDNRPFNTIEDILISYDFQAGSYNAAYIKDNAHYNKYHQNIADVLNQYILDNSYTICEAGVGEATTLFPVLSNLDKEFQMVYGFDISWSRIQEGIKLGKKYFENIDEKKRTLFVGDIFNIPLMNNSIDIVYTAHALEPNGGAEEQLLKELYRIASKYLILFEPIYELVNDEAKKRMESHGYVRGLKDYAEKLGYKVVRYELLGTSLNELNPTGVLVIEKNVETAKACLCDPISKNELEINDDCLYCKESMLAYPMIKGVPCLTEQNAILATKF